MIQRSILKYALFGVVLTWGSAANAETVLNFSSWVPPKHLLAKDVVLAWGKEVQKATDGRVKIRLLPKAVVSPPQHFSAIRDGLADITFITHGLTPGQFTLTQVAEFSFTGKSSETISVAYQRIYEKFLAQKNEHKGTVLLAVFTHGPGHMFNSKRPIRKLSDLDGLKIRVSGGVINEISRALGVTSMLKPAPQSYELLSAGVADGVFFPKETPCSFRLVGLLKNATYFPTGLYNVSFAIVMNRDRFDSLSDADRAIVMKLAGEHLARLAGRAWDAADQRCDAEMRKKGIKIDIASDDLQNEIRRRTQTVIKNWIEKAKSKGIDGEAVLEEFRAEVEKLQN